jgi:hypothetical protein
VERLFDLSVMIEKIFASAGLEYRVVGAWPPICTSSRKSRTRDA